MEADGSGAQAELAAGFRAAMRQLAATVTIVTTKAEGVLHGMTATAVTSLSADPPALLVCVNRQASIHPALHVRQAFCVNILGNAHAALASAFGGEVEPRHRFAHGTWREDDEGVPFLADAPALLFCTVDLLMDYGSHTIVVGKVARTLTDRSAAPLIYGNGSYLSVVAQPSAI
jgi:flavin reductase (DIM6/NTAB) family NADH-FMN oxidoreductase RutF